MTIKMNNCIDNKCQCMSMCCKLVCIDPIDITHHKTLFRVPKKFYEENPKYLELHNMTYVREEEKTVIMLTKSKLIILDGKYYVYSPCKGLNDKTGKCKYHFRGKPKLCKDGYTRNKDNLLWFNECIYRNECPLNADMVRVEDVIKEAEKNGK